MAESDGYAAAVERLAPCGLDCRRCVAFAEGSVKDQAAGLMHDLRGYEAIARVVADRVPAMAGYSAFVEVLEFFAGASCGGCRSRSAAMPFCSAGECFREKGVDFCFQCDEYPCERNRYPENLHKRWRTINDRMRDVGVTRYVRESLELPRY